VALSPIPKTRRKLPISLGVIQLPHLKMEVKESFNNNIEVLISICVSSQYERNAKQFQSAKPIVLKEHLA
jgi:hypothetical protein